MKREPGGVYMEPNSFSMKEGGGGEKMKSGESRDETFNEKKKCAGATTATRGAIYENDEKKLAPKDRKGDTKKVDIKARRSPLKEIKEAQIVGEVLKKAHFKRQIYLLIMRYLEEEGFAHVADGLRQEVNKRETKKITPSRFLTHSDNIRGLILKGEWQQVHLLLGKTTHKKNRKLFLYLLRRQEYLEILQRQEYQKAFRFLQKRLKPLEHISRKLDPTSFDELCYLVTCSSVREVSTYRTWNIEEARQDLADTLLRSVRTDEENRLDAEDKVPPGRLKTLLEQAVTYQFARNGGDSLSSAKITDIRSLMYDFRKVEIPTGLLATLDSSALTKTPNRTVADRKDAGDEDDIDDRNVDESDSNTLDKNASQTRSLIVPFDASRGGVKCVAFAGRNDSFIVAGLPDNSLGLWSVDAATRGKSLRALTRLRGHTGRVWDISTSTVGGNELVASASGDGTVRLWSLSSGNGQSATADDEFGDGGGIDLFEGRSLSVASRGCVFAPSPGATDLYAVALHPRNRSVCTGGFGGHARVFDLDTGREVLHFAGHDASVTSLSFAPHGNALATASTDTTVRFWDTLSGLCVQKLPHICEVTSVCVSNSSKYVLTASRDNAHRLWDMRTMRLLSRLTGHENTFRSFVRVAFGAEDTFAISGSEDGSLCVWNTATKKLCSRLGASDPSLSGVVYQAAWSSTQRLIASCSSDGTVRTWA